jgi:hypothetical protein
LANRIGYTYEDGGNRSRCLLHGSKSWSTLGHNQVWTQPNQFRSVRRQAIGISGSTIIYLDIITGPPSQLMELLYKRLPGYGVLRIGFSNDPQHRNSSYPVRLLRPRRDRPRDHRAAEKRDELAAAHIWPLGTRFVICRVFKT